KIIATLGPSSQNYSVLRKMMLCGLDVVRINFSHGNYSDYLNEITLIKRLNKKYRRHIKILGDLEGFRIRIGELKNPIELKKGKIVFISKINFLKEDSIPFDYQGDLKDIKPKNIIYIDDGNLSLEVLGYKNNLLKARVLVGGLLRSRKGVNIPEAKLKFGSINKKDIQDIEFCIENKFDYIAQSFVRSKYDIIKIRKILKKKLSDIKIIAKIECKEAIKNIDGIISVSDGIMIARGDLGISLPIYEVPIIQKEIIKKCKIKNKPVIVATQMLESMTENIQPTRAEVSDVANAILDGADYLMLSAETAVGKYPIESVRIMNEIIKTTEIYLKR
ncbi:MAG: pyruvate kinase, partial [Candidatus Omnitrophica bacterium]|nr:pyruvate kinase [Candidatus Omnitrophota bacterium]